MRTSNPSDFPHPGKVLLDELGDIGLSQGTFAKYIGVSADTISQLCSSTIPMTPVLACKISRALGGQPRKWLELQMNYDLARVDKSEYENLRTLGSDSESGNTEDSGEGSGE